MKSVYFLIICVNLFVSSQLKPHEYVKIRKQKSKLSDVPSKRLLVEINVAETTVDNFVTGFHRFMNVQSLQNVSIIPLLHVFPGLIVEGLTEDELINYPHIVRVIKDSIKSIRVSLPWGLDRIDQTSLPLNSIYRHDYFGENVDVYVVDTGNKLFTYVFSKLIHVLSKFITYNRNRYNSYRIY
jgi:serine protease